MLPQLHSVLNLLEGGFSQVKILVVGDIMLDRYLTGEIDSISTEAPVPVLRHAQRFERPGGAANVAMNLAGLGCQPFLSGFWGRDNEQAELSRLLDAANLDSTGVVTSSLPTTSRTRIVARTQQLLRLDVESSGAVPAEESVRLEARAVELVKKVHAVILADLAKGVLSAGLCAVLIRAARVADIPIMVQTGTSDLSKYSGATTICLERDALSLATGVPAHDDERLFAAAQSQIQEHDLKFLTVDLGEKGIRMLGLHADYTSPIHPREIFDVSGTGDTIIATIAASLAGQLQPQTSVELAGVAAAIVMGKVGAVPIARNELVAALTTGADIDSAEKIVALAHLQTRMDEWRSAGETIVFTQGTFDVVHVGHIMLLEECRRRGTKLVLGLRSNRSVSLLKGAGRPVVQEGDRARVVAALAAVDAVVLFDDEYPLELIRVLKPDVLVTSDDQTAGAIAVHQEVTAAGGSVQLVPRLPGYSTATMLKKLGEA